MELSFHPIRIYLFIFAILSIITKVFWPLDSRVAPSLDRALENSRGTEALLSKSIVIMSQATTFWRLAGLSYLEVRWTGLPACILEPREVVASFISYAHSF